MMESLLKICLLTLSPVFILSITSQLLPSYQGSLPSTLPLKVLNSG